jgi:asparagine synthase (glutamine-hydrolysing)
MDTTLKQLDSSHFWIKPQLSPVREKILHLLKVQEIPIRSLAVFSQHALMNEVSKQGVKVILGGQGADELFGGYSYNGFLIAEYLRRGQWAAAWEEYRNARTEGNPVGRDALKVLFHSASHHLFAGSRPSLFQKPAGYKAAPSIRQRGRDLFWNALYADFRLQCLPEYLHYEDRNSMAYSVESRLPFLGKDMLALGFGLTADQRIRLGVRKYLLRESLKNEIPESILDDRIKKGFPSPQAVWQRQMLKPLLDEVFASEMISKIDLLNVKQIRQFYEAYRKGAHDNLFVVWRIFCYALWKETTSSNVSHDALTPAL